MIAFEFYKVKEDIAIPPPCGRFLACSFHMPVTHISNVTMQKLT